MIFLTSPETLCFFQYKCLLKTNTFLSTGLYVLFGDPAHYLPKTPRIVIAMNPNDLYAFFYHDYLYTSVNSTSDVWGFFFFKLGFCKCKWAFIHVVSLSYGNFIQRCFNRLKLFWYKSFKFSFTSKLLTDNEACKVLSLHNLQEESNFEAAEWPILWIWNLETSCKLKISIMDFSF